MLKIKKMRIDAGYTQEEFAKKIGVSIRTYGNYEQGRRFPRPMLMKKILKELNTESANIFLDQVD